MEDSIQSFRNDNQLWRYGVEEGYRMLIYHFPPNTYTPEQEALAISDFFDCEECTSAESTKQTME